MQFAPLTIGIVKNIDEILNVLFKEGNIEKQIEVVVELAYLSLKRNYEDITREEVENLITFEDIENVTQALFKSSGFVKNMGDESEQKKT
jgi:acyl CoA:acetate/3-ketoacid CoA transferase beta subunit